MSATNLTKNLKLSQFVASDKPSWLGDVNGDNKKIDDGYGVLAGEISKANETASSAKSQSDANTQTLTNVNSELEDYGNRITALEAGGGTEQLEQRVNTLGSDVEALQTRADTFEGEISQNGTNITRLTERMTAVESKAKTNKDNITSLNSTTNSLSASVQSVSSTATQAKTNADLALNNASSANTKATTAQNIAESAKQSITNFALNAWSIVKQPLDGSRIKFKKFLIFQKGDDTPNTATSWELCPLININPLYAIASGGTLCSIPYNASWRVYEASIGSNNSFEIYIGANPFYGYIENDAENHELKIITNTSITNSSAFSIYDFPTILFNIG